MSHHVCSSPYHGPPVQAHTRTPTPKLALGGPGIWGEVGRTLMAHSNAHISSHIVNATTNTTTTITRQQSNATHPTSHVVLVAIYCFCTWSLLRKKRTALDEGNAFVDLSYRILRMAKAKLDTTKKNRTPGCINPCDVTLRVPYTFVPPPLRGVVVPHLVAAKPKPKAAPKPLSVIPFLKSK